MELLLQRRVGPETVIYGGTFKKNFRKVKSALRNATIFVAAAGEAGRNIEKMLKENGIHSVFTIE